MKTATIEIVDRGRGPQLSSSRITLLDLIPYFHSGCNRDGILVLLRRLPVFRHRKRKDFQSDGEHGNRLGRQELSHRRGHTGADVQEANDGNEVGIEHDAPRPFVDREAVRFRGEHQFRWQHARHTEQQFRVRVQ